MAGIPGRPPRRYTHQEKVALVTEIDRRLRCTGGSLWTIANELGTTGTSYLNWLKAGIAPSSEPKSPPVRRIYFPAERQHLLSEVERLHGEGQSIAAACRTVEISEKSFRKWKEDAAPPPAMRPVEITALVPVAPQTMTLVAPKPVPAFETLTLLAPGGYRVEGLGIESAAALLRALA